MEEVKDKIQKTGTTTIGIICKDGVILAADKRATLGGRIVILKKVDKVFPLTDETAVTVSGSVSDIQMIVKLVRAQIKLHSLKKGDRKLSVKEIGNLMASVVYNKIRIPSMMPSIAGFLLGGYDDRAKVPKLFLIGIAGEINEEDQFTADGSGMMYALGVLEAGYRDNMPMNEGIKLAVKAINAAIQRDTASGNGIDVITITKDGVQKVFEEELNMHIIA